MIFVCSSVMITNKMMKSLAPLLEDKVAAPLVKSLSPLLQENMRGPLLKILPPLLQDKMPASMFLQKESSPPSMEELVDGLDDDLLLHHTAGHRDPGPSSLFWLTAAMATLWTLLCTLESHSLSQALDLHMTL